MKTQEIREKKRWGDYRIVADGLGMDRVRVIRAYMEADHPDHARVMAALGEVILSREWWSQPSTKDELMAKKRQGDYKLIGEMLGLNTRHVEIIFKRPNSKRHPAVMGALTKIIAAREALLVGSE